MILVGILPVKNVIIQKVLLLLLQSPVRKWNIKKKKKKKNLERFVTDYLDSPCPVWV